MTAGPGIRIGVGIPHGSSADAAELTAVAQSAEALGFDSLWVTDHLGHPSLEPTVALTMLATTTERIRLGTSVMVLPGRNPAVTAKAMASLDHISRGRFLPILGLGRDSRQSDVVGHGPRGDGLGEALLLIRRFWTGEPVTHLGTQFSCEELRVQPTPVRGDIDVWLAGNHPAQQQRAGAYADGWMGVYLTPDEAAAARDTVLLAAEAAGREVDRDHFGVTIRYGPAEDGAAPVPSRRGLRWHDVAATNPDELARLLTRHAAAGIHKFILMPTASSPSLLELLPRWREEVRDLEQTIDADLLRQPARRTATPSQ